jgi:hypothetical protein
MLSHGCRDLVTVRTCQVNCHPSNENELSAESFFKYYFQRVHFLLIPDPRKAKMWRTLWCSENNAW